MKSSKKSTQKPNGAVETVVTMPNQFGLGIKETFGLGSQMAPSGGEPAILRYSVK